MFYRSLVIVLFQLVFIQSQAYCWFDGRTPMTYHVTPRADAVVGVALDLFTTDISQVTGFEPKPAPSAQGTTIRICQLDRERANTLKMLNRWGVPTDSLLRQKEAFHIKVLAAEQQLLVVGSDARGTAYGVLELSRLAGVSPWVWWGDVTPEHRSQLLLPDDFVSWQAPSVEYRGIFLNDEDWTLQPWSWQTFSPAVDGMMSVDTYRQIFHVLLRLRANAIWPGMHGMSVPFYWVPGAKECADSCGIVIGTSHCEPMMCNANGEWRKQMNDPEGERFNYVTNREEVQQFWIDRLKLAGKYENIYTIGMRGIHDGGMAGVKTLDEKTEMLQTVINDQREMLAKYVDKRVETIPQQFVPYKEVLEIMEHGLDVPDDVMLTWCDDNYGYMTRLSDSLQQQRSGGAGVYYHLSYWGRPHDYMWLTTMQPGLIYNEMRQAYDHNVRRLWIVNVHDLKAPCYDLELFLDMAWNIEQVQPDGLNEHLGRWLCREYGSSVGQRLLPAMLKFYHLTAVRHPEFMGWNKVETPKSFFSPRGLSPVVDTELSFSEFGNEAQRYIDSYNEIGETVRNLYDEVPEIRRDAYFAQVLYPVCAAGAMARKMLYAQQARQIYSGSYDSVRWRRDSSLHVACAKSQLAYQEIRQLTRYYNDTLASGKWKGMMCDNPRDLPVFMAPNLPIMLTEAEIKALPLLSAEKQQPQSFKFSKDVIATNACDYTSASSLGLQTIEMLGHSDKALSLPKGESVTYHFVMKSDQEETSDQAVLYSALIPTQCNDRGDIRYSIRIDDNAPIVHSIKEPYRSEQWKENVLRGQALVKDTLHLTNGSHTLTITALDEHIVLDQWMIDRNLNRAFYLIPVGL